MSTIKVQNIQHTASSTNTIALASDGTCTLASGSKLNNCTTDGTTNLTIADGNLVIATGGHGIDFSATSDGGTASSELFDDYEEGSFTPRLGGSTNNGTYYVDGTGTYIKIGKVVTVSVRFNGVDLDNNASGNAQIFNLPFTAGTAPANGVSGVSMDAQYYNVPFSTSHISNFYINSGSTAWSGLVSRHNTTWDNFPVSDFHAATLYMNFAGTYFTA